MRSKPKGEQLVNSFAGTFSHLPLPVFVGHSGSGRSVAPCILEIAHAKENPLEQGETHADSRCSGALDLKGMTSPFSSTAAGLVGFDYQHCFLLPHRTGVTAVRLTCPRFEGRAVGCAAVGKLSGWETEDEFHGAGRMLWRSCKRAAARQRGSTAQVNGR